MRESRRRGAVTLRAGVGVLLAAASCAQPGCAFKTFVVSVGTEQIDGAAGDGNDDGARDAEGDRGGDALVGCAPLAQDCTAPDTACYVACSIQRFGPACATVGTTPDGELCTSPTECRRGSACVETDAGIHRCQPLCDPGGGAPACATGSCRVKTAPCPSFCS